MKKRGLIVIDLQNEYLPTGKLPLSGIEAAADNAARVIADARTKNIPVFHIRHEFANGEAPVFVPGTDGVEIQPAVAPVGAEPVIVKNHINSFRDTDLKQQLDAQGVEEVVIVGAMSHMCVDACVRAAVDMGINHMALSRDELRSYVKEQGIEDRVEIPEDGAIVNF